MGNLNKFLEEFAKQDADKKQADNHAVDENKSVNSKNGKVQPDMSEKELVDANITVNEHVERSGPTALPNGRPKGLHLRLNKVQPAISTAEIKTATEIPKPNITEDESSINKDAEHNGSTKTIDDGPSAEFLFTHSGTDAAYHDQWMSMLERARAAAAARKGSEISRLNKKVCMGKFRLTPIGLEILPNMDTYGMSSSDILNSNWNLEG